jgi:hypothetical protein
VIDFYEALKCVRFSVNGSECKGESVINAVGSSSKQKLPVAFFSEVTYN